MALVSVTTRLPVGPVNRCIYCGATDVELTDEHIIPEGMRGRLELLKASCVPCQRKINIVETDLMKHAFHPIRRALELRGNKTKRGAPISIRLNNSERRISVPVADFPIYLALPIFLHGLPGLGTGRPRNFGPYCDYEFIYANGKPYFDQKLAALGLAKEDIVKFAHPVIFCRFLAKIAHAYASAMRFGGQCPPFQPYLQKFVRGDTPILGATFVGNTLRQPIKSSGEGHQTVLFPTADAKGKRFLLCQIRLFGTVTAWTYTVAVGRILDQ
jgi:hypothetical protein